jgi:hypothetical protein
MSMRNVACDFARNCPNNGYDSFQVIFSRSVAGSNPTGVEIFLCFETGTVGCALKNQVDLSSQKPPLDAVRIKNNFLKYLLFAELRASETENQN